MKNKRDNVTFERGNSTDYTLVKFKPKPPPASCKSIEQHEREATELANLLEERAREMLLDPTPLVRSRANQLLQTALKARAQATELAAEREQHDWIEHLIDHEREMSQVGRRDHRPRLRRRRAP